MNDVVSLFRIEAKRANLAIELRDGPGDGDRTRLGYRGYLTQVVLNLHTDVERYAYPDGGGGRVTVPRKVPERASATLQARGGAE